MYSTIRSLTSSSPCVLVEHGARVLGVEPLLGALPPRHGEQPVEVVADHGRLGGVLPHALEPAELSLGLLADGIGHAGRLDLRAVLLDDRALVLPQLLADRLQLLPEDVLALLLLHALVDVVADPGAQLQQREPLALQPQSELEPLADVDRLQQLDLLLEGQVGRVPGRVGQGSGLADRADERCDAAVVAAQLEDLLDDGAVLALQVSRGLIGRNVVGPLLDLDEEAAARIGLGGAGDATMEPRERHGGSAARQAHAVGHLCDGADLRVLTLVLGHE